MLEAIAGDLVVEAATVATELCADAVLDGIRRACRRTAEATGHEEFKSRCRAARAVVRTGEATPYANVILRAGVAF